MRLTTHLQIRSSQKFAPSHPTRPETWTLVALPVHVNSVIEERCLTGSSSAEAKAGMVDAISKSTSRTALRMVLTPLGRGCLQYQQFRRCVYTRIHEQNRLLADCKHPMVHHVVAIHHDLKWQFDLPMSSPQSGRV